jgi:acyl carrier protein
MNLKDIYQQVQDIVRDILDNDSLVITDEMRASDIDNWDSLAHISIITSIETHFKIRFSLSEIDSFDNIGAIIMALAKKLP